MEYRTETGLLHYDDPDGRWFEIRRWEDMLFVCVSYGQNLSAYRNGTETSRVKYQNISEYLKGLSRFENIRELYDWLKQYEDKAYGRA